MATYDVAHDKPDYEDRVEANNGGTLHILLISTFYALTLIAISSLIISFLVACLKTEKLRTDPGRWTQQLVAWAVLAVGLDDILSTNTNINKLPGMCSITLPLLSTMELLIKLGLLLTILERLAGVIKREPDTPGFSKRSGGLLIAGTVVGALVLSLGLWFGLGGVWRYEYRDSYVCEGSRRTALVLHIIDFVLILIIFVMTIGLIISLCRARSGNTTPYPMGRVVPVILGSLVIDLSFAIDFSMREFSTTFLTLWTLGVIVMMLVWLFGDGEVREAYRVACCPCCPRRKSHEEKATLLDSRHP